MRYCPNCEREFDHEPEECWACEIKTRFPDQHTFEQFDQSQQPGNDRSGGEE